MLSVLAMMQLGYSKKNDESERHREAIVTVRTAMTFSPDLWI